jgi:ABC-type lipoprotein release transport system permease subunit
VKQFNIVKIFLKLFFHDKSSKRFGFGVILGLGFSMAIVLATIGLMDGFEYALKKGAKKALGDFYVTSKNGYFSEEHVFLKNALEQLPGILQTPLLQVEAFAVHDNKSRAVMVRGVKINDWKTLSDLNLNFSAEEIAIGSELQKEMGLELGDDLLLALPGRAQGEGTQLINLKIKQIVNHGIYQKDLRFIYIDLPFLQEQLGINKRINLVSISIPDGEDEKKWDKKLHQTIPTEFKVRPFWYEYTTLIEAVHYEKYLIGIILQIIVVVAIFNVIAFILFLHEKKSQDIFLFKALGMSQKVLFKCWLIMVCVLGVCSSLFAILFVIIIKWVLANLSLLHLPAQIYYLESLTLRLSTQDYVIVYVASFLWLLLIALVALWKVSRHGTLKGLRQGFV